MHSSVRMHRSVRVHSAGAIDGALVPVEGRFAGATARAVGRTIVLRQVGVPGHAVCGMHSGAGGLGRRIGHGVPGNIGVPGCHYAMAAELSRLGACGDGRMAMVF